MFIAASFTIAKRGKQPKCSSVNQQISKTYYIHTVEYYLAVKRKATPIYATTQMNFKNIMPSEIDLRHKKGKYVIPLT